MAYQELRSEIETLIALGNQSEIPELITPENVATVQQCHPTQPTEEFVVGFRWLDWYAAGSKIAVDLSAVVDVDVALSYFSSTAAAAVAAYQQTVETISGPSALAKIDDRYREKTSQC